MLLPNHTCDQERHDQVAGIMNDMTQRVHECEALGQPVLHHMTADIGEAEVTALRAVSQPRVIDAE